MCVAKEPTLEELLEMEELLAEYKNEE
jgi:hypothetical protein